MRKLPAVYAALVFAALMSCVMAFIITCAVTLVNTGAGAGFIARWLHAFVIAWPLACVCLLLLRPYVQRLASRLIAS